MVNSMTNDPILPSSLRPPTRKSHHAVGYSSSLGTTFSLSPGGRLFLISLGDLHGIFPYFVYLDDEEFLTSAGGDRAGISRGETCILMDPILRKQEEILSRAQQNQKLKRIKSVGSEALAVKSTLTEQSSAPQPVSLPEFAKFDNFINEVLIRTAGTNGRREQGDSMSGGGTPQMIIQSNGNGHGNGSGDELRRLGGDGGAAPSRRRLGKLYHLIALIEEQVHSAQERKRLRQLLLDSQPRHSKWYDPNRPGQAELYDELERVLIQLKAFTPHSNPFLQRVSRKEVPDYYEIVKRPMDLSTMMKKLRAHAYHDRRGFQADLDLIYSNCYLYNSEAESPFRRHVDLLRERWIVLMRSVPDSVIEMVTTAGASAKDELDSLLTAHLDRFSDEESSSTSIRSTSQGSAVAASLPDTGHLVGRRPTLGGTTATTAAAQGMEGILCLPYAARSGTGMAQFLEEGGCRSMETDALFFHQSLPELATVNGMVTLPHALETPVPETVRRAALRFHHLRDLLRGAVTSTTAKSGEGESGQPLPSSSDWGRISSLPEFVKVIPASLLTPRRGRFTLAQSIAWLGMQAGFERVQRPALDCLTDIVGHYLGTICTALKLYIEDLSASATDVSAASRSWLGASYLVQEYEPRGASPLLRLVRDVPEQLERRLDRAIWVVRERLQALATLGTGDYRGGGGGLGDEEGNTGTFGDDVTAATDIDLDLLGGGDDSVPGGPTGFSGSGGNVARGWSLNSRRNDLTKEEDASVSRRDDITNDGDEEDDEEDPSGGDHDQSTLQELLDEPLDFSTPLTSNPPHNR